MRRMRWLSACLLLLATANQVTDAHAAKRIPLSDARFEGEVTTRTTDRLAVEVTTFEPQSESWNALATSGGVYVPLSGKVKAEYLFSAADQQGLADVVAAELRRHGIVGSPGHPARDIVMRLVFESGAYRPQAHVYTLQLSMLLVDGERRFERSYPLDSSASSTGWQKLNTSVWKGKMLLVQAALDALVPDVQAFLADNATAVEPARAGAGDTAKDVDGGG